MKKPNILLITTDQQHYSMLGAVNKILKTPNLDRLADEGMRFERAYCANPTCSPSRASILTGMYPCFPIPSTKKIRRISQRSASGIRSLTNTVRRVWACTVCNGIIITSIS